MKRFLICIILLVATSLAIVAAPERRTRPPMENRFLFIVDTSSGMKNSSKSVQRTVVKLLETSMQGQMHEGDTFGIWTYNDKVNQTFPMQVWSEEHKTEIIELVMTFLADQKY